MPDERGFPVFHTGGRRERDRYDNMLILCISIMTNARGCGVSGLVVAWCLFLCASLVCGADYRPHIHGERTERTSRTHLMLNSKQTRAQNQSFSCPTEEKQRRRPVFPFGRALLLGPRSSCRRRGVSHNIYMHSVTVDQVRIYLIAFIHPQCACSQSRGV